LEVNVEWPKWEQLINPHFLECINDRSRVQILYGGRGSSKSRTIALKIIYRMLTEGPTFKALLVRNTANSIKDSSYNEIKKAVDELGLNELFTFKLSPLEIDCYNGSKILTRGLDNPSKVKSMGGIITVWYEEEIPNEESWITISNSIRALNCGYLQEIFTIQPECSGNYEDNWFWKRFFSKNLTEKTFKGVETIEVSPNKFVDITFSCHHSTHIDNPHLPDVNRAKLIAEKDKNFYKYQIECLGLWGNRSQNGLFYKLFNRSRHVGSVVYNEDLPLHISFDFNVNPHITVVIAQIVDKNIYIIDEIAAATPYNTSKGACREFIRKYQSHKSGLIVYGDPSGKNKDTRSEIGFNDYKIIEQELQQFKPSFRIASKHPSVVMRGNFINTIFFECFNGLLITISDKCVHLINDMLYLKEAPDATKFKQKAVKDGVSYELWGHSSDALDYFICEAFKVDYALYQNGNKPIIRSIGQRSFNKSKNY
jgi:PBSX family phage terminase large subunit